MKIINLTLQTVFKTDILAKITHQFLDHYESRLEVEVGGKVFGCREKIPAGDIHLLRSYLSQQRRDVMGMIHEHLCVTRGIRFDSSNAEDLMRGKVVLDGQCFSVEIFPFTAESIPKEEISRRIVSQIMHKIEQNLFQGWEL